MDYRIQKTEGRSQKKKKGNCLSPRRGGAKTKIRLGRKTGKERIHHGDTEDTEKDKKRIEPQMNTDKHG
jgi:hypothetical protein